MRFLNTYRAFFIAVLFFSGVFLSFSVLSIDPPAQYIQVLGIAQDGGYPHIGCQKTCCQLYYQGKQPKKYVTSLGIVDRINNTKYLIEATPDITDQIRMLNQGSESSSVDGIFLTHAHIGHYTGLMYLGREALGAKNTPVYAMPKMAQYLRSNGPWSQLVALQNIQLNSMQNRVPVAVNSQLQLTPFLVPHRDEFSETVGYFIEGKNKKALFIPDIDKWHLWEKDIVEEVKKVDYAFIDATFYSEGEIPRPMSEVPHPFIEETLELFRNESETTRSKIIFIHLNHSNPALLDNHPSKKRLETMGYQVAQQGAIFEL